MKRGLLARTLAVLVVGAAACHDLLGPESNPTFDAFPDTVAAGDTVRLTFTLRNDTVYPITVRSFAGCPFFLQSLLGDESVPWEGTVYGCTAAVTDFSIPPRDSLHSIHVLVAARAGAAAGTALPAGTYRIRTVMNLANMEDLETEVTVTAGSATAVR